MTTTSLFSKVDERAARRLGIARQAFRSAERLVTGGVSDADRVSAVVQLDFAIETVLRAVLFDAKHHLGTATDPKVGPFKQVLEGASAPLRAHSLSPDVPGRAGLEHVRSCRNAAQHEARVPTQVEVHECLVYARDSLIEVTRLVWGVDFLTADVDAIRSPHVKGYLDRAAAAIDAGDLAAAMGWLRAAFDHAFTHGGENLVGPAVKQDAFKLSDSANRSPMGVADLATAIRRLQTLGRLTAFGIDIPLYIYWRNRLVAAPSLNIRDALMPTGDRDSVWSDDDYRTATAYVVDAVLRMEQVVDDVDPGGWRHGGFDKL